MDITIKADEIPKLADKAGKLVFKPSAEKELLKLLDLKDRVTEAIEQVKQEIYEAGRKVLVDFRGVAGDEISFYISRGDKYIFTGDKSTLPHELLKEITYNKFSSASVDNFLQEHKLPEGIKENDKPRLIIRKITTQNEKTLTG